MGGAGRPPPQNPTSDHSPDLPSLRMRDGWRCRETPYSDPFAARRLADDRFKAFSMWTMTFVPGSATMDGVT